jgi:diaminohydroxyphosphoribosylaminopyrimidine deaminase/5-amino-6-(5-phosphoribosylamino)uracil reductase
VSDRFYLERALELAGRATRRTSPNPMVGAVLVRQGQVVGEGWHEGAGTPHAEIRALEAAGPAARGATLYVNLEPCAHLGRTPPCAPRLVEAGVARVVVGLRDPNPAVDGKGLEILRRAGVEVRLAEVDLQERCARHNAFFCQWVRRGRPFVTVKYAMSADGKIATRTGHSRWISGEASRRRAHRERARHDAVLVGLGTVRADDPQLTVRLDSGPDPLRVVVDSQARLPLDCRLLSGGAPVLVACTEEAPAERVQALARRAEVVRLPARGGRVSLQALAAHLASRGVCSVLLEGGSELIGSALEEGLVDRVLVFVAPLLLGGRQAPTPAAGQGVAAVSQGLRLRDVTWERLGDDLLLEGWIWSPADFVVAEV